MIDLNELKNGLWVNEYMRIFSLKGPERVAEISNFPRVRYAPDSEYHYTSDVDFVVTEEDLNYFTTPEETPPLTWVYRDSKGQNHTLGQTATHFIGDNLPGASPSWVEISDGQPVPGNYQFFWDIAHTFLGTEVTVEFIEGAAYVNSNLVYFQLAQNTLFTDQWREGTIIMPKGTGPDKITLWGGRSLLPHNGW
jgi:hypothetical protein